MKRIFISADHGLAIVYFLQSDVLTTLLMAGVEVIVLTDDALKEQITRRFGQPGLTIEGLRLKEAHQYFETVSPSTQWWLNFLRRVGASNRINVEAMTSHVRQVEVEAVGRRKQLMPVMKGLIGVLRRSRSARQALVRRQMAFSPDLYTDLFEKYQPGLVVASTAGWRLDRYLLRQAALRSIPTAAAVVGWDNPSSYSLPGAPLNWINCWSEIQKQELVLGSDWEAARVNVGGIPSYDGYFRKQWLMSRAEYFNLHHLDPNRKLLGYACSFITFSPNYQNVAALAKLVAGDQLAEPSQLLIRLHPNHFMDEPLFASERERIRQLARELPNVHVVEPVPLGGELGYYSGEDMPEKTSMMAYSDVFLTVYSTMVVEAAIHDRPIVSVCFDAPGGWNQPGRFSLALSKIGDWPTHQRFRQARAGRVALNDVELCEAINGYLQYPLVDQDNRQKFIRDECTFVDGSAGRRTGEYLLSNISG
ncbi:MAG TPA: hypothetical protein VKF38_14255 [Anaerolineaceae bacterium]|nr:hypothetical protein [Anaerolineaceae bacterium]